MSSRRKRDIIADILVQHTRLGIDPFMQYHLKRCDQLEAYLAELERT